jgi:hypothetical protein
MTPQITIGPGHPLLGALTKVDRAVHDLIRDSILPQFVEFFPQPSE